jgi:hypothetical protein
MIQADVSQFELAINTMPLRIWVFRSMHSIDAMLEPGYFHLLAETGVRPNDRIEVHAGWKHDDEHGTLVVDSVDHDGIKISQLVRYARKS